MTASLEYGLPFELYRKLPALNISSLKVIGRSPLHYRHALANPPESEAMTLGTAAHCAVLEPYKFQDTFAVWKNRTDAGAMAPRRGKAWDEFVADAGKRSIITEDECKLATDIALAVHSDPIAAKYLAVGAPEVTMHWTIGDRPCKGRLDWLGEVDDETTLVGLKTTRDCRHFQFASVAARLGYGLQWAYYFDGYSAITKRVPRVVEIVVESAPPHAVSVYVITEDVLARGTEEYLRLLSVLEGCETRNEWPGPAQTELILSMPSWYYGSDDDISGLGLED